MSKRPKDMTLAELHALPIVGWHTYDTYVADADGRVSLPDGRQINTRAWTTIRIPRATRARATYYAEDDVVLFWHSDGRCYAPVQNEDGSWARREMPL